MQLERRTSVVYSAKASALALITVSITHSMPALKCMAQQAHECWARACGSDEQCAEAGNNVLLEA